MLALPMIGLVLAALASDTPPWKPGTNIQRTMRLLATSTAAHPNRVKILFYGQSITKQEWWKSVSEDLKRRFPHAELICENRAIGGFAASRLKEAVQHDVFPSYPDLIILHDYGGEPDYEELIRRIRGNVASEILIQSDHYTHAPPQTLAWHDRHVGWLRDLAAKDGLGFVDVRTPWHKYLTDKNLDPNALLTDGAHLNGDGCALMASLIEAALVYDPGLPTSAGLSTEIPLTWAHGRATATVDGNRIDVNLGTKTRAAVQVRIDGKRPSEIPDLYRILRPSDCFAVDVPAVFRIDHRSPLIVEDWTMTLTDVSADVTSWRFRVHGSRTGDDGQGVGGTPFVSRSGRVVIDPDAWYIPIAYQISNQRPPEGFTIHWQVAPEFVDEIAAGSTGQITVAQGLKNASHTLELVTQGQTKDIRSVTVYRPPVPSP